jgi:outer membrane lipoprotein-sorting protein
MIDADAKVNRSTQMVGCSAEHFRPPAHSYVTMSCTDAPCSGNAYVGDARMRLHLAFACALTPIACLAAPPPTHCPPSHPADPTAVYLRMCKVHQQLGVGQATFIQRSSISLGRTVQIARGRLFVASSAKIRVDYEAPERRSFIFNGPTAWVWEPETAQAWRFTPSRPSPLSLLVCDSQNMHYSVSVGSNHVSSPADAPAAKILLTSRDVASHWRVATIKVARETWYAQELMLRYSAEVSTFEFGQWTTAGHRDHLFDFTPPPGTRVMALPTCGTIPISAPGCNPGHNAASR